MRIFEEAAIRGAVDAGAAIRAVREAFRADALGRATVPPVINLPIPAWEGEFHIKTAAIDGAPYVAVKVASGFYRNPQRGLPSGAGLMMLFDAQTGRPEALLLDNAYLTDLRTGAAGAVAAEALAPRMISTVGVLGSGVQARLQLECLALVRPFSAVRCWSRTGAHAEAFCAELLEKGIDARAEPTPEAVVRQSQLLVTVTPSRVPLVRAEWLRPGMHVTAVGSDSPGKQELEPRCLERADLVVADNVAQCSAFGEVAHAPGIMVHAELGQIVAGLKPGRTRDDQITIVDLTGVGFQDTAIASAAFTALNPEP